MNVRDTRLLPIPLTKGMEKFEAWQCVHVDQIGPWNIKYRLTKEGKIITVSLKALTMIDRATHRPKFALIDNGTALHNAITFDKE